MLDTCHARRFKVKRLLIFIAALLLVSAGGASAETVWKWAGKDGKPVFGKQPPPGVKAEQVDIRKANVGDLGESGKAAGKPDGGDGGPRGAGTAQGRGNPLAQSAMMPVEIGGKLVESGSVRLKARAEGRDLDPGRATCPPEVPVCRKKGNAPSAGRPVPPRALQGAQGR